MTFAVVPTSKLEPTLAYVPTLRYEPTLAYVPILAKALAVMFSANTAFAVLRFPPTILPVIVNAFAVLSNVIPALAFAMLESLNIT